MASPNIPTVLGAATGTTLVVTVTFSIYVGAIYLNNTGANPVWISLDGVTAPVASDGTGRVKLAAGDKLNLENVQIPALKVISTAAFALQYIAMSRAA